MAEEPEWRKGEPFEDDYGEIWWPIRGAHNDYVALVHSGEDRDRILLDHKKAELLDAAFAGHDFTLTHDWGEAKKECYFCDWYSGDWEAEPKHDADCPKARYDELVKGD